MIGLLTLCVIKKIFMTSFRSVLIADLTLMPLIVRHGGGRVEWKIKIKQRRGRQEKLTDID